MAKKEKLNEEAILNNNLDASTLKMNNDITKQHQEPKQDKLDTLKNTER
ncbi:hypothetical protein [Aquibacillus rhizosphaerae]|uniref:Multidrug transporter n=1 Tax=Aquibacillus rhizosphaerae TaxID=3051431 RepID=A0ABT7LDB1_9BACI|nr:hypothetical protein [Aquibacillus sp. LR5S19]MDL4843247.1 hypothetical protein [Aquibacillus sp. LR5S19]